MTIAKRIIKIRESLGWSQAELARKTGLTPAAISQIEAGDRTPSLKSVQQICHASNISIAELTGDFPRHTDKDALIFYTKFRDIEKLKVEDQQLILALVKRLRLNVK